jgi:hypothetical protein
MDYQNREREVVFGFGSHVKITTIGEIAVNPHIDLVCRSTLRVAIKREYLRWVIQVASHEMLIEVADDADGELGVEL